MGKLRDACTPTQSTGRLPPITGMISGEELATLPKLHKLSPFASEVSAPKDAGLDSFPFIELSLPERLPMLLAHPRRRRLVPVDSKVASVNNVFGSPPARGRRNNGAFLTASRDALFPIPHLFSAAAVETTENIFNSKKHLLMCWRADEKMECQNTGHTELLRPLAGRLRAKSASNSRSVHSSISDLRASSSTCGDMPMIKMRSQFGDMPMTKMRSEPVVVKMSSEPVVRRRCVSRLRLEPLSHSVATVPSEATSDSTRSPEASVSPEVTREIDDDTVLPEGLFHRMVTLGKEARMRGQHTRAPRSYSLPGRSPRLFSSDAVEISGFLRRRTL